MGFHLFLLFPAKLPWSQTPPPEDGSLDLTGEQGRDLLHQELQKPVYQDRPSLIEIILKQLNETFNQATYDTNLPPFGWIVAAVVVVSLVALVMLLLPGNRYVPNLRKPSGTPDSVVFDDQRSAIQYLAAAKNALSREDYTTAFLEQFRHLLRLCETNGLLLVPPGLTALEATRSLGRTFSDYDSELQWSAQTFNALRYGRRKTDPDQIKRLQELDSRIEAAIPTGFSASFAGAKV